MRNHNTILVAEDEPEVRSYLELALRKQGYSVELAQDGEEALRCLHSANGQILAVLLDLTMPRKDGLEALLEIRTSFVKLPVIMMSSAATMSNIVNVMKAGADDFVAKPIAPDDLKRVLAKVCGDRCEAHLPPAPASRQVFFGSNPRTRETRTLIRQISLSDAPVLIQGETGAGKEVIAREIHANSKRASKPFQKLNCAALPSELVESELFGYERGAFTGAYQRKPGMFEIADGGTLLLDEIGDMDFKLQAKLLQILQDQTMQRLGGKETLRVDVRVIAATHQDLERAITERRFREDLFYRLNVINLKLPPLRDCPEDIIPLAEFLLRRHTPADAQIPVIGPELRQALLRHRWPGNVRELENTIRRLVILQDQSLIARTLSGHAALQGDPEAPQEARAQDYLSPRRGAALPALPLEAPAGRGAAVAPAATLEHVARAKERAEAEMILNALNTTRWNRKEAAVKLGIEYKALLYRIRKLGIDNN